MEVYPDKNKRTETRARALGIAAALLFAVALCLLGLLVARVRNYDPFLSRPALPYAPQSAELIDSVLQSNVELSEMRRVVVESAVSLNGKVDYFWGGKSGAIGFDPEWGQLRVVEGKGDETTGQTLPYGMDCSGFLNWCFVQAGLSLEESRALIGNGTENQWNNSQRIRFEDLQPGDFIFKNKPGEGDGNHVGIVIGFTADGEPLLAHCSFTLGGCVISGRGDVFRYPRRPNAYAKSGTEP
ncbi:MAG: NlpC/P60 family protein [Clostridiales bacterium]|nr:NlpC/P60 family protein [Clostridiales bacterium]